jgi:hypothetical protein
VPAGRPPKLSPLVKFESSFEQVDRLLHLYDELVSERKYKLRSDLRQSFQNALHITPGHDLDVAHKKDWKYYILIDKTKGGNPALFTDGGLSVLLRQAVAFAVSCMDGFFRDKFKEIACERVRAAIGQNEELGIWEDTFPFRAVAQLDLYERTGSWQRWLLGQYADDATFQAPSKVAEIFKKIGVKKLWEGIHSGLPHAERSQFGNGEALRNEVQVITDRRNRIVHDADRTGSKLNPICIDDARKWASLLRLVVVSADKVIVC